MGIANRELPAPPMPHYHNTVSIMLEKLSHQRSETPTFKFFNTAEEIFIGPKENGLSLGQRNGRPATWVDLAEIGPWGTKPRASKRLLGVFRAIFRSVGSLGHRTTAIVSTRRVGKSLGFRATGAPREFFQVDRETPVNKSKLFLHCSEMTHTLATYRGMAPGRQTGIENRGNSKRLRY